MSGELLQTTLEAFDRLFGPSDFSAVEADHFARMEQARAQQARHVARRREELAREYKADRELVVAAFVQVALLASRDHARLVDLLVDGSDDVEAIRLLRAGLTARHDDFALAIARSEAERQFPMPEA